MSMHMIIWWVWGSFITNIKACGISLSYTTVADPHISHIPHSGRHTVTGTSATKINKVQAYIMLDDLICLLG